MSASFFKCMRNKSGRPSFDSFVHNYNTLDPEDRVDVHSWLKLPHKCTQTPVTCSLHPSIPIIIIFGFFLTVESLDESFFNAKPLVLTSHDQSAAKPNLLCGRHCSVILMSRYADRSLSSLYLADLRSMQ